MQLKQFDEDFEKTGETLATEIANSIHLKTYSFVDAIVRERKKGVKKLNNKPLSDWTLSEYRKLAPQYLENDPELYKRLLQEEQYNKDQDTKNRRHF